MTQPADFRSFDPGDDPQAAEQRATAQRHAELLGEVRSPSIPSELRSTGFLDSIYERAARDSEQALDSSVERVLREPVSAPEAHSPFDAPSNSAMFDNECAEALRDLESVPAPSWIRSRVREDLVQWTHGRRRARLQRRTGFVVAAAALVILSMPLLRIVLDGTVLDSNIHSEDPRVAGVPRSSDPQSSVPLSSGRDDIVIVRHRVSQPLSPGFSTESVIRGIVDAGGPRGR